MPIPLPDGPLKPGTYVSNLDHAGPYPNVILELPEGWSSFGGHWVNKKLDTPGLVAITFWNVHEVYVDGCHWRQPRLTPGRGSDELAQALAERPLRNATTPVDVTLAGYSGMYLRWSVPDDIDFADCDVDPVDGKHYFESWTAIVIGGDRYQQGPGQVDEIWILDVDGNRVVIDAMYMPGSSEEDIAEMRRVVETLQFE